MKENIVVERDSILHGICCGLNYFINFATEVAKDHSEKLSPCSLWRHLTSEFACAFLTVVGLPLQYKVCKSSQLLHLVNLVLLL